MLPVARVVGVAVGAALPRGSQCGEVIAVHALLRAGERGLQVFFNAVHSALRGKAVEPVIRSGEHQAEDEREAHQQLDPQADKAGKSETRDRGHRCGSRWFRH